MPLRMRSRSVASDENPVFALKNIDKIQTSEKTSKADVRKAFCDLSNIHKNAQFSDGDMKNDAVKKLSKTSKLEDLPAKLKIPQIATTLPEDDYPEIEKMSICEEEIDNYDDIWPISERLSLGELDQLLRPVNKRQFSGLYDLPMPEPGDLADISFNSSWTVEMDSFKESLYDDEPLRPVPLLTPEMSRRREI